MNEQKKVIYQSSSLALLRNEDKVFVRVLLSGVTIFDFNELLKQFTQVKITQFLELQRALKESKNEPIFVGIIKERYELEISTDEMSAYLKINFPNEEIEQNKEIVISEILKLLADNHILTGIHAETLNNQLETNRKLLIAEGIRPIPGEDSILQYHHSSSNKPLENDNGEIDFYELDLICNVKKGDWLGEKTLPRPGKDGLTVRGNHIPARMGADFRLKYDPKTVEELFEVDKYVLRAKQDGAVTYISDKIAVENHLYINGDVDFETGNIYFDGSITIKGTIKDKFIVEATGDIEINSDTGVGAIERIESLKGSIYIKGGVNSKGEGAIIAKNSIYTKYVNEGNLTAENDIKIALYAFDSQLTASRIYIDPKKGKIVGGQTNAKHKVVTGSIGNLQERPTMVNVEGFDRLLAKAEFDALSLKFNDVLSNANRMKRKLVVFEENYEKLDERAQNTYKAFLVSYENILDEMNAISKKANQLEEVLKTRGEGEIKVFDAVYPKTLMALKQLQKRINEAMKCSFYVKDNQIHLSE